MFLVSVDGNVAGSECPGDPGRGSLVLARFSGFDLPPRVLRSAEPAYPDSARKAGIEGRVWLLVTVDTIGNVIDVSVARSEADILNDAAIKAAYEYEFMPATLYGRQPVESTVSMVIDFALDVENSRSYSAVVEQGRHYLHVEYDYPSAAECFRRAIVQDPANWEGYFYLAAAYVQMRVMRLAWYNSSRAYHVAESQKDKDSIEHWMRGYGLTPPGTHPSSPREYSSPNLDGLDSTVVQYHVWPELEEPDLSKVRYPALAREEKLEGTVIVRAIVDKTGRVIDAEIWESDAAILSDAALEAVYKWRFALRRPAKVTMTVPFRFPPPDKDAFGRPIGDQADRQPK